MKDLRYITGSLAKTETVNLQGGSQSYEVPSSSLPSKVRPQSKSLLDFLSTVVFQLYVALYNLCNADGIVK